MEILVKNEIVIRAEQVQCGKKGYRLKKHASQIFTNRDKFYWKNSYAPFIGSALVG